jgi:phosphoenolpyruvate carboxykinase (GTP)
MIMTSTFGKDNPITSNAHMLKWVERIAKIARPSSVIWITGDPDQLDSLRQEGFELGILEKLNEEKLPGCVLHRSNPNDVARVEDRTFICTRKEEDAGPTNNWMDPKEMYAKLDGILEGAMEGREMYILPFSMGVVGSPFAKYGVEITDSIYVVLSMAIMTRMGKSVLDAIGDSKEFTRGVHSKVKLDPENRYIAHFPEDNTIISLNSGYGGNVLLGKKCLALRLASFYGNREGWLAEHMLILGIENPRGEVRYVAAAFPSACGKTNLAMLIPPAHFVKSGWKVYCVGDDIAWLRLGEDGRLWAVNPEYGFFGVAPGTNAKTNPNALETTKKNTIFTNVVKNLDDNTVWWEGLTDTPPAHALDWKGEPWTAASGQKGAHPNSRFTAPAVNCPCISSEFNSTKGVPISAIIFGGRRAKTAPLVYQARDWNHGVFVGSIMASETTAAKEGAVGVVRRDPMAMLPFCGYHMGDYWKHWIEMGTKIEHKPKIFNVNWFRTNDEGKFIWPGFGDNLRVLEWILSRCHDGVEAIDSPIGLMPHARDIDIDHLDDVNDGIMKDLLTVDKELWKLEMENVKEFYSEFGDRLPKKMMEQLTATVERLNK